LIKIFIDQKFKWVESQVNNITLASVGIIKIDGQNFSGTNANKKLVNYLGLEKKSFSESSISKISKKIKDMQGNFAIIVAAIDFIFAATDKKRSYPVFYSNVDNNIIFSNNASWLKETMINLQVNKSALLIYKMSGYTLGGETIYQDLFQLQAGQCSFLSQKNNKVKTVNYFQYFPNEIDDKPEQDKIEELHEITKMTFNDMINTLDGRPVVIPLSGGYDSRLILTLLKEFKYDNFITFTYGLKNDWQVRRARFITEKLNVPWHFLYYEPKLMRKYFHTDDRKKYFQFGSGFCSTPTLQTYYSILELNSRKLLPNDAIMINGQSGDFTSGGHIPDFLQNHDDSVSSSRLIDAIINKHFSLWTDLKIDSNIKSVSDRLMRDLNLSSKNISLEVFASSFELFEFLERQSKHVIGGQRAYDWFGFDWRLPFWSDELMEYWLKIHWTVKFQQKLFLQYLKRYNFQGVFNIELPKSYSYLPGTQYFRILFYLAGKIQNRERAYYYNRFLKYHQAYSPYYPQKTYCDFLKDSKYHRNVVSYLVKQLIKEEKID